MFSNANAVAVATAAAMAAHMSPEGSPVPEEPSPQLYDSAEQGSQEFPGINLDDSDDEEEGVIIGGSSSSRRGKKQGSAHTRLLAALSKDWRTVYAAFGIQVPPDMPLAAQ